MKFFFPDSQDLVSPTYDFIHDEYSPFRVRQRDDLYAHEVLNSKPYDGILVSKAIIDGSTRGAGKYSEPQRQRLYRFGVRRFFRLPDEIATLGDCGAFNYVDEPEPPYSVNEVVDFYDSCGFDAGISVDHVILGYERTATLASGESLWRQRRTLTLRYAEEFINTITRSQRQVTPVGVAQGWSPDSYADSVRSLQDMGYIKIALGGMIPLKTPDILECLKHIDEVRNKGVELHLLGITRIEAMQQFAQHAVTSFDSTSSFRQSFMDDRNNYHTSTGTFVAIRVPQVDANVTLKRAILAGKVSQKDAITTERECLKRLRGFDNGSSDVDGVLEALQEYERLMGVKKSYVDEYRRTLAESPWRSCECGLCARHGIEIAIFRGTERNKRRGFHNLSVLATKMHRIPALTHQPGSIRG